MKELIVISGKGGTGKTSVVASFAALSAPTALADCDVDAADLHLILAPTVQHEEPFSGGKEATVIAEQCVGCGKCATLCRFGAISRKERPAESAGESCSASGVVYEVDPTACEGCGVCAWFCPAKAISFTPAINGHWYRSETRHGPMVHAKLGVAEENSGKLVSTVRQQARALAGEKGHEWLIVDGSPGVGCPVIASITGADMVLIVTEPTLSGIHDLGRVASLALHFGIPAMVCINKWDLNPEMTERIESWARKRDVVVAGRIRYDKSVTDAQVKALSVVEHEQGGGCAEDIRRTWSVVREHLTR